MDALIWILAKLNVVANALGVVLTPLNDLAGWLHATIVGVLSGLAMLVAFKHTSNQKKIGDARRCIRANLLALKLFKYEVRVVLGSQWRVLVGVSRLLLHCLLPLAIMMIPTCLLLSQLGLRYQAKPLRVNEEAVLTVSLNGDSNSSMPKVELQPSDDFENVVGPVRVFSKREVCWNIRALKKGQHRIVVLVDGQPFEKELTVGGGFVPVSTRRPEWNLMEVLLHPREEPFRPDSPVKRIEIEYPERTSFTSGADDWIIYWMIVAFISMLLFRRVFRVNL